MFSKLAWLAAAVLTPATAQVSGDQLRIDLAPESPVSVVSMDWGTSKTEARGGAMVIDLHTALKLRNVSSRRIHGVTLLVLAQDVTPGGKASVAVPSLNAAPGEVFPVRIDLRLLRPLQPGAGPLVRVHLDGVLFEDLSFFGPNVLNSRRTMTVWELEARRDRAHFRSVLEARGPEGLQEEVLASLARQAERPRLGVEVARRTTNIEGAEEHRIAFLKLPDAPVEGVAGLARMGVREAGGLRLTLANRSSKPVRHVEVGWILRDVDGHEVQAGAVPAGLDLAPGATAEVTSDRTLRFSRPLMVERMSGYVTHVEFADGQVWIPPREGLAGLRIDRLSAPSPEEQRLTNLYRRKGLQALIDELR